jgi:hypothetical protein
MDRDPAIFVTGLQGANKKLLIFLRFLLIRYFLHHFPKIKVVKSHKTEGIKVFLTIFA